MNETATKEATESTQVPEKRDWLAIKPIRFWDQIADYPGSGKYRTWRDLFWYFVVKQPWGCWEWKYQNSNFGYGKFFVLHDLPDGTREEFGVASHRLSYLLEYGEHPGPLLRHRCDNPPCIRPTHLIPGTHQENSLDMVIRGRCPKAKLDILDVAKIRVLASRGVKHRRIAEKFGITEGGVSAIVCRRTWTAVTDELKLLGLDSPLQLAV